MNKRLFYTLLVLLCGTLNSAEAQESIQYAGKTYKVYPYRMEHSTYYDLDIPFYPGKLIDGEYAVLFAKPKMTYPPSDFGTDKYPCALLQIKNGVKEGKVVFFDNKLSRKNSLYVLCAGEYKNNLKSGTWKHYEISAYGFIKDSAHIEYEAGLRHGVFKQWKEGTITCLVHYKNGKKHGLRACGRSNLNYKNDTLDGWQIDSNYSSVIKVYVYMGRRSDTFTVQYLDGITSRPSNSERTVVLKRYDSTTNIFDSSTLYYNGNTYESGNLVNSIAQFSEISDVFEDDNPRGYGDERGKNIYYKTDFYDSLGKLNNTLYYINGYSRLTEMDKTEATYEVTTIKPKHKNYTESLYGYRNTKKKKKYYFIPYQQRQVIKALYTDSALGTVYRETLEINGEPSIIQEFYVSGFEKKLIYKQKFKHSYFTRKVEINKSYNDRLETFSPIYYTKKMGKLPLFYLTDKMEYINFETWAFIDTNQIESTISIKKDDDKQLIELTGRGVLSELDNNRILVQSIDYKQDKHHKVAIIWKDTICITQRYDSKNLMGLTSKQYYPEHIGQLIDDEGIPVKMGKVYLDGRPYNGILKIYAGESIEDNNITYIVPKESYKERILHVPFYKSDDESYYRRNSKNAVHSRLTLNIHKGEAYGEVVFKEYWSSGKKYRISQRKTDYTKSQSRKSAEGWYSVGQLHGDFYKWQYYGNQHLRYKYGKLVGLQNESGKWTYTYSAEHKIDPGASTVFINDQGELHGHASVLLEDDAYFTVELKNGLPNGGFYSYTHGKLSESAQFNEAGLHGSYKAWYYESELDTTYLLLEAKAVNNHLVDTVRTYFMDGKPSCVLILSKPLIATIIGKDKHEMSIYSLDDDLYSDFSGISDGGKGNYSGQYSSMVLDSNEKEDSLEQEPNTYKQSVVVGCSDYGISGSHNQLVVFSPEWSGYYQYFYKSGHKSQEGRAVNGTRSGIWKFYNESGYLFKEVDYNKGSITNPFDTAKSIVYSGKCKGYNNMGKPIYEGLIVDEDFDYTCATEVAIAIQDIYFTAVFDSLGNNILNTSQYTPVQEYQISGAKLYEGFWYMGQRDSIWKYFDAGGNLNEIGKYAQGKRQGRWISGDLIGINYIDNACFKSEDDYRIDELRKQLEFTETFYENGKVVDYQKTQVQTDGYSGRYGWYGFNKVYKLPKLMGKKMKKELKYSDYKIQKRHGLRKINPLRLIKRRHHRISVTPEF
ncbi:MAG: hypothetical protein IT244_05895 [Bacteroidia bacterium]|nr:hypothetical protein [Bacteroidia bacterium]